MCTSPTLRDIRLTDRVGSAPYPGRMCRNIRTLHNFAPPATRDEIRAAAVQYVRKVSGMSKPSAANQAVFDHAVDGVAALTSELLESLVTTATPRDREVEAAKAKARSVRRFGEAAAAGG
jgi:hypothetical protein